MGMAACKPTPLFANLFMYAVNKAASRVLGKSALILSRSVSEDLWNYLVSRGVIPPNPTFDDLRRLFVEELGVAEDVTVEDGGETVVITIRGVTLRDFVEALKRERIEPVVCPLTSVLVKMCENMSSGKLVLQRFELLDGPTARVVCKKV